MPHTNGPWTLQDGEDEPYAPIEIIGDRRRICRIWLDDAPVPDFNAEQEANARLIAAAPDLLAALINMVDDGDATDREQALRAIAKARGE